MTRSSQDDDIYTWSGRSSDNNWTSRFWVGNFERRLFERRQWNAVDCKVAAGQGAGCRRHPGVVAVVRCHRHTLYGYWRHHVAEAGSGRVFADHQWTAGDEFTEAFLMWEGVAGSTDWPLTSSLSWRSPQHLLSGTTLWLHLSLLISHLTNHIVDDNQRHSTISTFNRHLKTCLSMIVYCC